MSETDFEELDDLDGPKALRKAYKETAKENAELKERIERLEALNRGGDIRSALSSRGLDPRVAKFYPSGRATTDESVDEWVEENRDLFGARAPQNTPQDESTLLPEEREGYDILRKIQRAEAATEMDFKSKLAAASSPEEVIAMMKEFGAQRSF